MTFESKDQYNETLTKNVKLCEMLVEEILKVYKYNIEDKDKRLEEYLGNPYRLRRNGFDNISLSFAPKDYEYIKNLHRDNYKFVKDGSIREEDAIDTLVTAYECASESCFIRVCSNLTKVIKNVVDSMLMEELEEIDKILTDIITKLEGLSYMDNIPKELEIIKHYLNKIVKELRKFE